MAKQTEIKFNLDGLEELKKGIGSSYFTKVGILAGAGQHSQYEDRKIGKKTYKVKTGPSTISMVELGLVHEFGSVTNNIPPRSFLRLPLETKRRDFIKALQGSMVSVALEKGQYRKIFAIMGLKAEEIIQDAFSSGGFGLWPVLKAGTIRAKRSSKILIDTGELRKSITSQVVRNGKDD